MVMKRPTTTLLNRFSHLFRKPGDVALDTGEQPLDSAQQTEDFQPLRSKLGVLEQLPVVDLATRPVPTGPWWGVVSSHGALTQQANHAAARAAVAVVAEEDADEDQDLDLDFTGMQALPKEPSEALPLVPVKQVFTAFESAMRDAALLYAEGKWRATQTMLMALLAEHGLDDEARELLIFSLFDVYRCSGQQQGFEALAFDYAERYGRSPAEWFAIDQSPPDAAHQEQARQTSQKHTIWHCPVMLDAKALAECLMRQPLTGPLCAIDWSAVRQIDPVSLSALAAHIAACCESLVVLQWQGLEALLGVVDACRTNLQTPKDPAWWLMQLDLLRLLDKTSAFEEVALDYCVAFEISPPSWQAVVCTRVQAEQMPALPNRPESGRAQLPGATSAMAYVTAELEGNITGVAPIALTQVQTAVQWASQITVSCARLGRIDLLAAGSLLAWVKECNARDCAVHFVHLPRLVMVYFHMLGMEKIASVSAGSH